MSLPPDSPARGPAPAAPTDAPDNAWESTRLQTQYSPRLEVPRASRSDEQDIGRPLGDGSRELFVACEPADALVQQFDHLQTEFIAVHDLGVAASQKLLAGIAAAGQQTLRRLVIRRNGAGTELAVLQYVDCPAHNGQRVRLYSTTIDGDTRTRQAVSRVLLGRSRLGIVLVGDQPSHALQSSLQPWREASLQAGWLCRRMLFMPLVGNDALASELARFRAATVIDVSLTPKVAKPAEVWSQLCLSWNLLQRQSKRGQKIEALPLLGGPAAVRALEAADTAPGRLVPPRDSVSSGLSSGSGRSMLGPATGSGRATLGPTTASPASTGSPTTGGTRSRSSAGAGPAVAARLKAAPAGLTDSLSGGWMSTSNSTLGGTAASGAMPMPAQLPLQAGGDSGEGREEEVPTENPLDRFLNDVSQIDGVISACAFDIMNRRPIGHVGARPGAEDLARQGTEIMDVLTCASQILGLGATLPEVAVTFGHHHLLVRPLPAHPGMALHVVLDKPHVALALVQMQLRRLEESLIVAVRMPDALSTLQSRR